MGFNTINYRLESGIANVALNRPDRLNALTVEMLEELNKVFRQLASGKDGARALLLTGAGKGFCSGADLVAPRLADAEDPREVLRDYYNPTYQILKNLGIPTIAAVNGPCVGAGMSLALSCDVVLAAKSAYFLAAFANIGLVPDAGASWLLPRLLGNARATGMMLLGDKIPAEQAEQWGLIWRSTSDDALLMESEKLAQKLSAGPTKAYGLIKQLIRMSDQNSLPSQMQMENEFQGIAKTTEDVAEARKAFSEKRPPLFKGR